MHVRCGAALSLLLLVSGCSISPLSQRATAFSTAAMAVTLKAQNADELVEQSYTDAQMANLVNNFDTKGFNTSQIQSFMPTAAMQARTQMIAGLQQYATLLAEVSGNQSVTALDTQSEAVGKSLQGLSTSAGLSGVAKNAKSDIGLASSAVDALGRMLIEHKTAKELPGILTQMQKPVDDICQLLEDDIGTREGGGLRNQLENDYDSLIAEQRTYIYANEAKMTPDEKRTEIKLLPQLVTTEQQDDATLAQTQAALKAVAATNDALATTKNSKQAPAFRALLVEIVAEGQQIGSVYNATMSK
jgi:hypothetical protein